MKKKRMIFISFLITFVILICGCNVTQPAQKDGKCSIVCTVFPIYDWTRILTQGLEEDVDLHYLFDDGSDVHSFQPGADDYVMIAESDIFIYISGAATGWIEDVLNNNPDDERIVIDLAGTEGIVLLDNLASAHSHEEENEAHTHDEHCEHEEGAYDEHIWMSPDNAKAATASIADALNKKLTKHAITIDKNEEEYLSLLEELNDEYVRTVAASTDAYMLVADRFPFLYMAKTYGISFDSAFAGCQTESEADFDMIVRLASLADEHGISSIAITEVSDEKLAQTVIDNMKNKECEIVVLDSMQAVSAGDVSEGKNYLSTMRQNLEVLKVLLGE